MVIGEKEGYKMTLSGITLLWLLMSVGCLALGVLFTLRNRTPYVRIVPAQVCCKRCGEKMAADARFCGACGKRLHGNARQPTLDIRRNRRA